MKVKELCSFEGCGKPSRVRTLCSGHWNQQSRGQELRPLRPRRANGSVEACSFEGCRNTTTGGAHGLCRGHNRQRSLGRELHPLPSYNDNLKRDDNGRKRCASCREWFELGSFHVDSHRPDGLNSRCTACVQNANLIKRYGVDRDRYDSLMMDQGGGCAICGAAESSDGSMLAVDHDHSCCPGDVTCGRCVRGLLCRSCNQGLGNFSDNTDRLYSAVNYLASRRRGTATRSLQPESS